MRNHFFSEKISLNLKFKTLIRLFSFLLVNNLTTTYLLATDLPVDEGIQASKLQISDVWIRAMPPGHMMSAAYFKVHNLSSESISIISVTSADAQSCNFHQTKTVDGIVKMQALESLEIPSQDVVQLQPAGIHLMLMGIKKPLQVGEKIPLLLQFSNGTKIAVDAQIRR